MTKSSRQQRRFVNRVIKTLNHPYNLTYWFRNVTSFEFEQKNEFSPVIIMVSNNGMRIRIRLARTPRDYSTREEAWCDEGTIFATNLWNHVKKDDSEGLCEAITNGIREISQYEKSRKEADKRSLKAVIAYARTQPTSRFERSFFAITSRWLYRDTENVDRLLSLNRINLLTDTTQENLYDWDSKRPKTIQSELLFKMIQDKLPETQRRQLRFYCTLGSFADRCQQTDLIIALVEGEARVTSVDVDLGCSYSPKAKNRGRSIPLYSHLFTPEGEAELDTFVTNVALRLQNLGAK